MGACCSTENSRATEHPPVRKPEDASKKPAASSKRIEDQPRGPVKQPAVPIEPLQPAPEEDSPQAFTSSYPGLNGDSTNRAPGDGSADGTLTLRQTTNSNDETLDADRSVDGLKKTVRPVSQGPPSYHFKPPPSPNGSPCKLSDTSVTSPLLPSPPFPADHIRFNQPTGLLISAVTPANEVDANNPQEMLKTRLFTTECKEAGARSTPNDAVHFYAIPSACILAGFAHVRGARLNPSDTPFIFECDEDMDVILAVHEDNPSCLQPSFTRVITNNSYSRILSNAGAGHAPEKWFRLYHKKFEVGAHAIEFNPDVSFRNSSMNQFTFFFRPCELNDPPLYLRPMPDEAPKMEE